MVAEPERLEEIERLDLIDKDVINDRHLNNITELACYLTNRPQCTINLLRDKSLLSKNNHGFNIAARLESACEANKIQISEATRQFLEKDTDLTDRGFIELKNKGEMQTFFLNQIN